MKKKAIILICIVIFLVAAIFLIQLNDEKANETNEEARENTNNTTDGDIMEESEKIEVVEEKSRANDLPEVAEASLSKKLENYFVYGSGSSTGNKVEVYDGTIEKYNGYYYVMGTGSMGNVYRSEDMIHWESRYQLISRARNTLPSYADNIYPRYGASDLLFHNGVMFYGFNGNNLIHGDPSTMHTKPDFRHSFLDEKYDDGIDVQFFVAHNGDLLYLRKVNPGEPDPNTGASKPGRSGAWLWVVDSFFNEKGNPGRSTAKELLYSQPGHWGNLNYVNFEGPEMYYHNGQYYLLYASNQMFPETGLYDTGVAQADHYDEFDNSTKYPDKLLARNIEQLILKYNVILATAEHGSQEYQYTFEEPEEGWETVGFNTTGWKTGEGGFGYPVKKRAEIPTIYNDGKIKKGDIWGWAMGPQTLWARRSFQLESVPESTVLRHRLEGFGEIYVNGQELISQSGQQRAYKMTEVPKDMLKEGENVISVEIRQKDGRRLKSYHMDFGLYDTNGEPVEADIIGPSQPNVIKGANGFETWITYKAFWNSMNGQGKDRVYFWDDEMVADGPTSADSPDLHFDAWAPTFHDRFESDTSLENYASIPQEVTIQDEALYFNTTSEFTEVLFKDHELANYYMETNIRFDDSDFEPQGRAGVTVWHQDNQNHVRLLIDRNEHTYIVSATNNGETTSNEYDLPATFRFLHEDERAADFGEQYHPLKVYKNGSKLFAELGHYKLNNDMPVLELEGMSGPGKIGLVCLESKCSMDNVTVTAGWTEYGSYFSDWGRSWTVTDKGLTSPSGEETMAVKGDRMKEHEFSVNIDTGSLAQDGKTGIIVEYIDDQNYVAAYTNYENKQIEIRKVVDGKEKLMETASTARDTIYGHSNYDGKVQKTYEYDLRGTAEISQAKILWTYGDYGYLNTKFRLPNVNSSSFGFDNWVENNGNWEPVDMNYEERGKGDYHIADFASNLITDKMKLNVPEENNRPFTFALREEIRSQNFFKTVRTDGYLYVWVNNELIFAVEDPFKDQPAKIGLYTENIEATYNALTAFEVKSYK